MISATKKFTFSYKKILPVILVVVILAVAIFSPLAASTAYAAETTPAPATTGVIERVAMTAVNGLLASISYTMTGVVIVVLTMSGFILDLSIQYSLTNFTQLTSSVGMVTIGWGVLRDLANLVFIFLILWVAISTILGLHHGSAMGSVLRIVIAALLINFSLFITQVVVDVANIVALHFYNLTVVPDPTTGRAGSLAGVFMQALNPQSIYPTGTGVDFSSGVESKILLASIVGSIAMLVAAWVFIAAAVMFIIRTIYLMILMIFSPFAFIAWVIPGFEGSTHDWWSKLLKQAFFAPIFLVMMYIIGYVIQHGGLFSVPAQDPQTLDALVNVFSTARAPNTPLPAPSVVGILINYLMLLGMIVASLLTSSKLGAVGASTMISWGNAIRNTGQSWVGGRTVGLAARAADERLGKTWVGNTAVGKTLREWTVIPLKDSKFGGHLSAEERHKEDLELASKRKEAAEVQGSFVGTVTGGITKGLERVKLGGLARGAGALTRKMGIEMPEGGAHNAEALIANIENMKKAGESEISTVRSVEKDINDKLVEVRADPARASEIPALESMLKDSQDKRKEVEQRVADKIEKERGELQKILVKLTPHAFEEMMPKNLLFTPEMMRNASRSQLMAVLGSEHFAEIEKDKVRAARYGHIKDANEKVEEANKDYDGKYQKYIAQMQVLESEVAKGFASQSFGHSKELDEFYTKHHNATSDQERSDIINSFIDKNATLLKSRGLNVPDKKPEKKSIGDVASDVRVWIRAMADQEADEMYRYNPQLVLNPNVASTLRSSVTRYMRQSESIASIDKDKMRDAKLGIIIDAEDLSSGIGELAPSFKTFEHMIDSMIAAGYKDVEILKKITPDDYKKYEGSSKENSANWEQLKEDYLRKAVKKIALDEGNYQEYLDSFNEEQKAISALGEKRMIDAIAGYSSDEFPILRGVRWRTPSFARKMTRGIAQEFRQKDTGDIKEVMDMVLFDLKNYLEKGIKISRENMDLLHWVATETSGKAFKNRTVINPELHDTFDKMEKIFAKIGRNGKPTYEAFETAKADLGI